MKVVNALAAAVLGLAALAHGHMEMTSPPPFRSKHNPNTANIDYSMTAPISGSQFPCKGYHSALGTKEGASVATWTPGQTYQFTLAGSANHFGGSCQASLSYDQGKTWKVVHSYVGGCPVSGESSLSFNMPSDAPPGEALFAWTWFNRVGNREMYMNCAAVTIKGGKKRASSEPFKSRPDLFVANIGNDICTYETTDVEFPNPGPEVTRIGENTAAPGTGACKGAPPSGGGGGGSGSGNNAGNSQSSATPTTPTTPTTTSAGGVFITSTVSRGSSPSSAATSSARPSASPVPSGGGGGDGGNSSAVFSATPAGSRCGSDGLWNCLADGGHFQRCASGVWSAIVPVAPGTTCKPGQSNSLEVMKKRGAARGWGRRA